MTVSSWTRYRFRANEEDYRPVKFPPPGPYWCSGYGEDYAIVIAWLPSTTDLTYYWPEATEIVVMRDDAGPPAFTSRFTRPHWYMGEGKDRAESPSGARVGGP